ncbi:MAG TPA: hypothetical protein DCG38_02385 [Eubacteriaceae bacterium]|nr:hypothetical protein [Eubacteriaceae bacterium]
MLKKNVVLIIENATKEVQALNDKLLEVKQGNTYSAEYKANLEADTNAKIQEINTRTAEKIKPLFSEAIAKLDHKYKFDDETNVTTSNILSMLTLSKNSLTEAELQQILDENAQNNVITRAVLGIAEDKHINLNRPVDARQQLETWGNRLYTDLLTTGIDNLGGALMMEYLPDFEGV